MLFLGNDETILILVNLPVADIAATLSVCTRLRDADTIELWHEACKARWGMLVEDCPKETYFVRNAVELAGPRCKAVSNAENIHKAFVSQDLDTDSTRLLVDRLVSGGLQLIGSHRDRSPSPAFLHGRMPRVSDLVVYAAFGTLGQMITFHFRREYIATALRLDLGSRWVMKAHLVPHQVVREMYDYTLYTPREFDELIPGVKGPGDAVRRLLSNFAEGTYSNHFSDGGEPSKVCESGFLVSEVPQGCTEIDLLVSTFWPSIVHRTIRLAVEKPCPFLLSRLLDDIGLHGSGVKNDDLLFALLILFADVTGFEARQWTSTPEFENHLWINTGWPLRRLSWQ